MEDLVVLLTELLSHRVSHPFDTQQIVVQNPGMKHWLLLNLARRRGVAMNYRFPLPGNFFWQMIKLLLPSEALPEISEYTREIMVWRIYRLLEQDEVLADSAFKDVSAYWKQAGSGDKAALKRFQLASQLADLFEQYLIYRPDWIEQWDQLATAEFEVMTDSNPWQGRLWALLVKAVPLHPLALLQKAEKAILTSQHLPKSIFLFGMNALPPIWLQFLRSLSQKIEVHFFILNPSDEYWQDVKSEQQIARQRAQWIREDRSPGEILAEVGNPLLGSLGQQGQTFIHQLCEAEAQDIPVFESPGRDCLLHAIQDDILHLKDGRDHAEKQDFLQDTSLVLSTAHSALREVQGLHDWLLDRFEQDSTLMPRDVLVMCPKIEDYSSCIEAVFGRSGDHEDVVSLPCTIADRKLSDAEPLIQVFNELLQLPDSRFQVSQIFSYLRIHAIQRRFNLAPEDIDNYERWINHAAVHWGLDARHKADCLEVEQVSSAFTWQQGLERLLLGFAFADSEQIYDDQLLLPWVDADHAIQLGQLVLLLDQIKDMARALQQQRTIEDWYQCLKSQVESLFSPDESQFSGYDRVMAALDHLLVSAEEACEGETLPLSVVRDYLQQQFNQPEQGQQFMVGQVTFCSMVPMRSIPFKIIALLGLNDGHFPRQRIVPEFDLMAQSPPRAGDRSRRGDDRYLFLEALMSARESFYLSYQAFGVQKNNPREPSVVLTELVDYVEKAYGAILVRAMPLQPFSIKNFVAPLFSYDARWLNLTDPAIASKQVKSVITLPPPTPNSDSFYLDVEDWVRFFDHPAKVFAQQRLNLFFETSSQSLEDAEPFVSNYLQRYLMQNELVANQIQNMDVTDLQTRWRLSGSMPDTPLVDTELDEWVAQGGLFAQQLNAMGFKQVEHKRVEMTLPVQSDEITPTTMTLLGELPLLANENQLVFWRFANYKGKDLLRLWLHHLMGLASGNPSLETLGLFRGKEKVVIEVKFKPVDNPIAILQAWKQIWIKGQQSPLGLSSLVASACFTEKRNKNEPTYFEFQEQRIQEAHFWLKQDRVMNQIQTDPYYVWLWPAKPDMPSLLEDVLGLYAPLFDHLQTQEIELTPIDEESA
jgi:exodeoxyribonuclease V gamma subunit